MQFFDAMMKVRHSRSLISPDQLLDYDRRFFFSTPFTISVIEEQVLLSVRTDVLP